VATGRVSGKSRGIGSTTLKGTEDMMEKQKRRRNDGAVTVPNAPPGALSATMTHNDVERRAHQLYCERGCEDGHDLDHWLQAESEVRDAVNVVRA
jgi:hypothetical protein